MGAFDDLEQSWYNIEADFMASAPMTLPGISVSLG